MFTQKGGKVMSEFNNFGGNPQDNGQNNNSFGSTPGDMNNFGGQSFGGQNFGGQNYGGQNYGSNINSGLGPQQPNANGTYQNMGENFGGNYGPGPNMYSQNTGNNNVDLNSISLWKTLSIIQIIIGCCGGLLPTICGIVSLVCMNKSKNALLINDIINANANYKTGKIFNLVGWGILVLGIIANILAFIFGAFEAIFN